MFKMDVMLDECDDPCHGVTFFFIFSFLYRINYFIKN